MEESTKGRSPDEQLNTAALNCYVNLTVQIGNILYKLLRHFSQAKSICVYARVIFILLIIPLSQYEPF